MRFNNVKILGGIVAAAMMFGVAATSSAQPSDQGNDGSNQVSAQQAEQDSAKQSDSAQGAASQASANDANKGETNQNKDGANGAKTAGSPTNGSGSSSSANPGAKAASPNRASVSAQDDQPSSATPRDALPTTADCQPYHDSWKATPTASGVSANGEWTLGVNDSGECALVITATDPANEYQLPVVPSSLDDASRSNPGRHPFIKRVVFNGPGKVVFPAGSRSQGLFENMSQLRAIDGLDRVDTSYMTDMSDMFSHCSSLASLDVSHFDTSGVTDMENVFAGCSSLASLDVSHFDTRNVTKMNWMFANCSSLASLDVSRFDTHNVTTMEMMFKDDSGLTSLDMSDFDTSKVTRMNNMFQDCKGLASLDLAAFDTSNVTDMSYMFSNCFGLTSLDVSHFNIGKVLYMQCMFAYCNRLQSLDLSSFKNVAAWNTDNALKVGDIYTNPPALRQITIGEHMYGNFQLKSEGNRQWVRIRDTSGSYLPLDTLDQTYSSDDVPSTGGTFVLTEKRALRLDLNQSDGKYWGTTDEDQYVPGGTEMAKLPDGSTQVKPRFQTTKAPAKTSLHTSNYVDTYFKFVNWNTKSDGSGTAYAPGDEISMDAGDVTLYAQWKQIKAQPSSMQSYAARYVLRFKMNPPADSGVSEPTAVDETSSTKRLASRNDFTKTQSIAIHHKAPTVNGYRFDGWTIGDDSTVYKDGDSVQMRPGITELKANWTKVYTYRLNFMPVAPGDDPKVTKTFAALDGGVSTDASHMFFIPFGYTLNADDSGQYRFLCWVDAQGHQYYPGSWVTLNSAAPGTTLYGSWKRVAAPSSSMDYYANYALRFKENAPAGSGVSEPASPDVASTTVKLSSRADLAKAHKVKIDHAAYPKITGYRFDGWSVSGDESTLYQTGGEVSVMPGVTELTGHWTKLPTPAAGAGTSSPSIGGAGSGSGLTPGAPGTPNTLGRSAAFGAVPAAVGAPQGATIGGADGVVAPSAPKSAHRDWRKVECGSASGKASGAAYVIDVAGYRVMASGNVCVAAKSAVPAASTRAVFPWWLVALAIVLALIGVGYVRRNRFNIAKHRAASE
ncbi:BspA family leucine-rich repeat surface protein [Bifidobacterium sp. ESL0790]|uniref:BspA family leucine-rich repeat surface protein n=1 Tax=Bifidobacterium sp. ESL0790 TaxID=2983233 RepID=UPI0023FA47BA|nr:BspA family leucine-rich repeat surface protein [Bifidobacterium sp. ESL0790]WEV72432.1 BspA family leucine-rich repeat surface protein [Bifidobacterium sp. ESL0790]